MEQQAEVSAVFTMQQLDELGRDLSQRHKVTYSGGRNRLLKTLKTNEDILRFTYRLLRESILEGHKVTPAGDWLIDNFHVIEDQIRTAKLHLPRRFSRELPMIKSANGLLEPRVYVIASELIHHTDGRIDRQSVERLIESYQAVSPLGLGELWAFPIMLRLGLLDNLRIIAESIAANDIDQRNAKIWAEKLAKTSRIAPHNLVVDIADLARSEPRLSSAFVSEFARRVQNQCHCPTLPLNWIEQRVGDHGLSIEQHHYLVSQDQAHDQISISNSISSLRFLNETDWRDFVERVSVVEKILQGDPRGIYAQMDFSTRDSYRHVIERYARYSSLSEPEVAEKALDVASTAVKHIGEYLLGTDKQQLAKSLRCRFPMFQRLRSWVQLHALFYYLTMFSLLTLGLIWVPATSIGQSSAGWAYLFILLLFFPASQAAVGILNWFTAKLVAPKLWPRMNFGHGIPESCKTIVVVPCMLSNEGTVDKIISDIEVRYLGNRDPNILFALLTDFKDATSETQADDDHLLAKAQTEIEHLNHKYADSQTGPVFYLLHRPRLWNPKEGLWMGYERKRGKLAQFNQFLLDGDPSHFAVVTGDRSKLKGVAYVITLDVDSTLPRETAAKMIATMAHPLNRPVIDADKKIVRKGYAILQPRVTLHIHDRSASLFSRLFSDEFGIDPYTKSTSDVYQDLFDEGSFIGKGIYDLQAFHQTLAGRFPENRILSHDLIEGGFARSGLVSDVQLIEEYPSDYSTDARRKHRWIRGDWQVASWMLPLVPTKGNGGQWNPLSGLSRWKLFDNVRRSLTPIATLVLLLASWLSPILSARVIALAWLSYLVIPLALNSSSCALFKVDSVSLRRAIREKIKEFGKGLLHLLMSITLLPYESFLAADASILSMYRLLISKRNLLQWQTADDAKRTKIERVLCYYRMMWFAPVVAGIAVVAVFFIANTEAVLIASAFGLTWFTSPWLAWWVSRPAARKFAKLTVEQIDFLRLLARKNWSFFDRFVNSDTNWLPPDNFQEYPDPVLAQRTSPTNIGLAMLSDLAAFDFGYITIEDLLVRSEGMFASLDKLARYKGHFYNWYDTQTLEALHPHYISSVDSGNLLGSLLVFRQGLMEIAAGPLRPERILTGLGDVFMVIEDIVMKDDAVTVHLRTLIEYAGKCLRAKINDSANSPDDSVIISTLNHLYDMVSEISQQSEAHSNQELVYWIQALKKQILQHRSFFARIDATSKEQYSARLNALADRAAALMRQDYSFLFNPDNQLLAIGYHVLEGRRDHSYYDLLASESRLASFMAIASGNLPQDHWFALGRQLVLTGSGSALLSWSGSMFEYLMPLLMLPNHDGTLLDLSCRNAIHRQIEYGREKNVPWGISESGYNVTDLHYNYQYRAFGVPGLGFKSGLEQDLVIAPYATAMALMLEPTLACKNLADMAELGFMGRHGFYEAIDYTPARVPTGSDHVVVKSFMVHHQGMSFLSLAKVLLGEPMQRRMKNDPAYRSTELLLFERVPKAIGRVPDIFMGPEIVIDKPEESESIRVIKDPALPVPEVHLLGNGRYHVMVTSAGSGYSVWNNQQLTRWRDDPTQDGYGYFIYLHDHSLAHTWSAGFQPIGRRGDSYEAIFSEGRAEFRRTENGIDTHTEIAVSPDDDCELRRITLTNHSDSMRTIDITSYAEVVMAAAAQDQAHPAFSNLFIETEMIGNEEGIICHRRRRTPADPNLWLYHAMVVHGEHGTNKGIETDRAEFIGRNHSARKPITLERELNNHVGAVVDPVIAIRKSVQLKVGEKIVIDCILGVSEDRQQALALMQRFRDRQISDRVLELAWTHGHVLLRQLNCTAHDAVLFGKLAGFLVYNSSPLRASETLVRSNTKSQSALWGYGISGDLPIVLVRLHNQYDTELLQQIVRGHDYWRRKGLAVDLVLWNESTSSYRQDLQEKILEIVGTTSSINLIDQPGGIFIRRPEQMPQDDRINFEASARIVLSDDVGSLEEQIYAKVEVSPRLPRATDIITVDKKSKKALPLSPAAQPDTSSLKNYNGYGGFSTDGREYVMTVGPGQSTPMPWVNVLANSEFGTLVSESGSAYTWSENAQMHRLTPWFNDPVVDPSGEALFLRDELAGHSWSATPAPKSASATYEVRHGFGYSQFSVTENDVASKLLTFVAVDCPVKFMQLRLQNHSARRKSISLTMYLEIILGENRRKTAAQIVSEMDPTHGHIYARNVFAADFRGRVTFLAATEKIQSFTADRGGFIGRNRSLASPAAMGRVSLSGTVGARLDPCLALRVNVELDPGQTHEVAFVYGVGISYRQARKLSRRYSSVGRVHSAFSEVQRQWDGILGKIAIDTPEPSLNTLGNGWLLYQTLASRVWGRTGFYQSGGAFGFRDQLQDMMALVYSRPELVREHILLAASRQFVEGDVQHWWHPPSGRGVRTSISDDYLWLPYVVAHYVRITADKSLLAAEVPFLTARKLNPGEESDYGLPSVANERGTIYDHCQRALRYGMKYGPHGLPLMGSGDWNDGMNHVGSEGKGESVWLGFFLIDNLKKFMLLASEAGDHEFVQECRSHAEKLRENLEKTAWDGAWYLRAFFDNGMPLGSAANEECRIDSLPQSWSVLSGAGDPRRAKQAMESVFKHLVRSDPAIVQLFDPPFNRQNPYPGYIAGYLQGVRENGGQYTHAALWVVMAFAELGDVDRAYEILQLISPVLHGDGKKAVERYKVEPYVMAADVYASNSHSGRGGWTWYTGAAAWYYRTIIETFLGFELRGDELFLRPRLPNSWPGFKMKYQHGQTSYFIVVTRDRSLTRPKLLLDGAEQAAGIKLIDNGQDHQIYLQVPQTLKKRNLENKSSEQLVPMVTSDL